MTRSTEAAVTTPGATAVLERTLGHARLLCAIDTVSSKPNAETIAYVADVLGTLGFATETSDYEDRRGVPKRNLIARIGPPADAGRGLALSAHVDVVPADDWHDATPGPFTPTLLGDRLYARGACDMKGPLAAMLAAAEAVDLGSLAAPLFFLITADEEVGFVGARNLRETGGLYRDLAAAPVPLLVGEPTELAVVHGHKGSCLVTVTAEGVAGHSSGTEGRNANWAMIPFLAEMAALRDETERDPAWRDDRFVPPTLGWNVTLGDGNGAINVTSPRSVCRNYVRPMPGVAVGPLLKRLTDMASRHGLAIEVERAGEAVFVDPASPFVTEVRGVAGVAASSTVSYGTDAAAFVADLPEVVICGPGSIAQAHTRGEYITLDQLGRGVAFFRAMIERRCG